MRLLNYFIVFWLIYASIYRQLKEIICPSISFFFVHFAAVWIRRFFLIHFGITSSGLFLLGLLFLGFFLFGGWLSHNLLCLFIDFPHLAVDILGGNDGIVPLGGLSLFLFRGFDPNFDSFDVIDGFLPFFRSNMLILLILNNLTMYQRIEKLEVWV